jgi:hypothetical protein
MRLVFLLVTVMAVTAPTFGQEPATSTPAAKPSAQDEATDPVSLNRIRERLKKPDESKLRNLDVRADFSIQIEEQRRIDEIMSKLDFKSGPVPAGGLYSYEQQRRLFNPTDRPLQQPYAAFSGGELITIAIENLIAKYLGGRAISAVTSAERSRAESQARQEVDQAVAQYCAQRSDRADIELCNPVER